MKVLPMLLALISLVAIFCSACSGLEAETLVPDRVEVGDPHPGSVRVDALGSKPVGDDALAQAVRSAITASNLFESVAEQGAETCDWVLAVTVTDLERDSAGLTMAAKATFDWSLRADSAARPVWSQTIVTGYSATPDDTPFVEERGRIATTRAVQENIRRALVALGELELD